MSRAVQAAWLIIIGATIATGSWGAYIYGRSQWANHDKLVEAALGREPTYNATPFLVIAGIGAFLILCGVIIYAGSPPIEGDQAQPE